LLILYQFARTNFHSYILGCTNSIPYFKESGHNFNSYHDGAKDVIIYPNPASKFINVISENEITGIKLYDVNGILIKEKRYNKFSKKPGIIIDELDDGFYFIHIYLINDEIVKTFIKKR